jgi:hypothetical protein
MEKWKNGKMEKSKNGNICREQVPVLLSSQKPSGSPVLGGFWDFWIRKNKKPSAK